MAKYTVAEGNKVTYENEVWSGGTPIDGERLATNGYYTGEHVGSVMQDATASGVEVAHATEAAIVRYGTRANDALNPDTK